MPPLNSEKGELRHWRSLAELEGTEEFRAHAQAEFIGEADPSGVSRRRLMQLMGASAALAGVAGCRWEREEILPFAARPANRTPGVPVRYCTAMDLSGVASGLMVTSYDGRPIKVEGNPKHSLSQGATSLYAQAALLDLYDPDRGGSVLQYGPQGPVARSWDEFWAAVEPIRKELRDKRGQGLAVLAEPSSSPTLARLRKTLGEQLPEARWCEYEPLTSDSLRDGSRAAFGRVLRTHYDVKKADVLAFFDADLLGDHPAAVAYARAYAQRRDVVDGKMNRLYVVESTFTVSGANADHRLPVAPSQVAALVAGLERLVAGIGKVEGIGDEATVKFLQVMAADLSAARGRSLVAAGPSQPAEVHAAIHRINAALGNVGAAVVYFADPDAERPSHAEALAALTADMAANKVSTLIVLGGNPVYDAPVDLKFAEALQKVGCRIRLGVNRNETSPACQWHLPEAHFLESWGDGRAFDGTYSVVQPLIEPLFGGRTALEVLSQWLDGKRPSGEKLVRDTFKQIAGESDLETRWARTLHNGLLDGSRWVEVKPDPKAIKLTTDKAPAAVAWKAGMPLEVVFRGDRKLYDGRFANNGWLQELPDPVTKLGWDNAAILAPSTAAALGVADNTLVRIKCGDRQCEMPAHVLPGHPAGTVTLTLGYGRTVVGQVGGSAAEGVPAVGVDVYRLRASKSLYLASATVEPTGRAYALSGTMHHHAIDAIGAAERAQRTDAIVREASLAEYKKDPKFAHSKVEMPKELKSLWEEPAYTGHRWAMSIDLNKCTGCSACVVACQAENNVPIVGREQVLRGREMHWLRVDRYFVGSPDSPRTAVQPMTCQHCEMAPCEQVCPVAATVHSAEGLNDMVYNRCVGTRYCANNCPYKVRRFNYFNFHKDLDDPSNQVAKMKYNPEVTVRPRGVMEKCTYCVQRIQSAKIVAKNERRDLKDGEIVSACQQVCPTEAIVFGDLSDKNSRVSKLQGDDRAYGLLAEFNFKPRTAYLAKLRNPNPALETPVDERNRHST